jgi:ribosomal protein L30/L7E
MASKTQAHKLAAILIRGQIGSKSEVKSALRTLRLLRRHVCVILPDTQESRGMLALCKDYIAYGPVDEATLAELASKRKALKGSDGKPLNVYRLHPPRGGYGSSTKLSYQEGGVLGLRRERMGELIRKML